MDDEEIDDLDQLDEDAELPIDDDFDEAEEESQSESDDDPDVEINAAETQHRQSNRRQPIRSKPSELTPLEKTAILSFRVNELAQYTGTRSIAETTYLSADQLAALGPITHPPIYWMQKMAQVEFNAGLLTTKLGVIRLRGERAPVAQRQGTPPPPKIKE
jgi:hypothetical protein